jgi:putative flippase GtrA
VKRLVAASGPLRPLLESAGFGQLVRFGIGGLGVTLFATLVYSVCAGRLHVYPLLANLISYCAGVIASYAVHSRWSFRAGGKGEEGTMMLRFLVASGLAFALNNFWVWLLVLELHLSVYAPVPAMMMVTPLASFVLNRWWVFRAV